MPNITANPARARRVNVLLAGLAALCLADLAATLHAMLTTGMYECNPIAAALMHGTSAPSALAMFKLVSLAVATGILYGIRGRWQAELGAWVAVALLVGVMANWALYYHELHGCDAVSLRAMAHDDPAWVCLN